MTCVEADRVAVEDARHNLADRPQVRVERGRVDHVLRRLQPAYAPTWSCWTRPGPAPAGPSSTSCPGCGARRIAYVACDPAALARDLRCFGERGYRLDTIRAFDLFPMTHHVECVALLAPTGGRGLR